MTNKHRGSCLCGCVKYEILGDFQSFFLCYCTRCQKGSGSAHAANLFAKSSTLTWLQGEDDVSTYKYPKSLHVKSFCQKCGSALPTFADSINSVVVPAGSLDSPIPITPTAKIFVSSCASWSMNLHNVLSYEKLPDQAKI
ncbi:TPA: GFA family protein [Vibrio alginolyticus]|uniref:GFA family protein n=1 Tax=Vibrio TaxID=662 RepID=UPI002160A9F2|nr:MULTISPECIES: GFA family protein [Vibrio]ELM4044556.1 GFA family protein [Vibrio parahaemolyticus]EIP0122372.1 GFA family protein [Vibrio alginolyticus]MCS0183840.1 GFA family protein [Vibrio alginolyticus]MDW1549162.1 GFA family protein [Vibrio sp. YT-18]HCZ9048630.1 GFA family protein [Vibrio alginolyticus]